MSTPASDLYQQNAGVRALNSGPIVIRTYNDLSGNNTYFLGKYDIPISSNYVLITSADGKLAPSNAIYVSSIAGSTMNASIVSASTVSASTVSASTVISQFINYSTLSGSTISTNSLAVTNLIASNISVSSLALDKFLSLTGSTITTNTQIVNSTLLVSTLIAANISVSSLALDKFSTLTGSSIIASTLVISTITTNTQIVNSTLVVSTLTATNINIPTVTSDKFSTLTGSSIIASTLAISTITTNTQIVNSTLVVSTLTATNINIPTVTSDKFSTLTGSSIIASTLLISTITSNTIVVKSTLLVSTLIATNISVSSLALDKFSTLTGSSIIASTLAISTITSNTQIVNSTLLVSTLTATNVGIGTTTPQYNLDVAGTVRNSVNMFADNSAQITATPALDYTTFGQNLTAISQLPSNNYNGCAISANGQYQVVTTNGIYYSSNYGQSWTLTQFGTIFYGIAMSASGQYVVVCSNMSPYIIYISSNYGQTWVSTGQQLSGVSGCITMSASGQYISAVSKSNQIYISNNNGITWQTISLSNSAICVIMSASGQYQIVGTNAACYYSLNYGQTWQQSTGTPNNGTNIALTMSASGQYAIAAVYPIGLYSSSDYGKSWSTISSSPTLIYTLSMSASGQYVIGGQYNNINNTHYIYYSINYGINWIQTSYSSSSNYWNSCEMSSSGQYLLVANTNGNVVKSITEFPPQMITSQSTTASTALNISAPNITIGQNVGIFLGKNTDINNYGMMGFQYVDSNSAYNYLYLGMASNAILCINSIGYVGIGTTNPASLFTVNGLITCGNINASPSVSITAGPSTLINYSLFGQIWTPVSSLPVGSYKSCAMSANGKYRIVTRSLLSGIYVSSDYGQTWSITTTAFIVSNVAISANGQYAITSVSQNGGSNGNILISPNFGQGWGYTPSLDTLGWYDGKPAISSDGRYMIIVSGMTQQIMRSANYGQTWTYVGPSLLWGSVAMSSSGQYQYATTYNIAGFGYYSSDYGLTWTQSTGTAPSNRGYKCSMSSSGLFVYIAFGNVGGIYISSNAGQTWTASNLGNASIVATSESGQYAIASSVFGTSPYYLYYSTNYGQNWTASSYSSPNSNEWKSIALSASGQYAFVLHESTSVLQVSSELSATSAPLLNMVTTDPNPFTALSLLASNITSSTSNYGIVIGKSASNSNSFQILYNYIGLDSTFNNLSISTYNNKIILTVIANGNVGIGINPLTPLHVNGTITSGSILPLSDNLYNIGSIPNRFAAVHAANGTIQTSDSSEKDLILLPYGLNEVMQVSTIMYKWKSQALLPDTDPSKNFKYYGVCADQLSNIFPELIYNEDPNVPMQLNYSELIPVVIKAIQEQSEQITILTQRLTSAGIP